MRKKILSLIACLGMGMAGYAQTEVVVSNPDSLEIKESRDSSIYENFEFPALFPGGQEALEKYLKSKLRLHYKSLKKVTNPRIILRFVIDKDGSVSKVEVVRSSGNKRIDKECVRVVRKMPRWQPASESGKTLQVRYYLPIPLKDYAGAEDSETNENN